MGRCSSKEIPINNDQEQDIINDIQITKPNDYNQSEQSTQDFSADMLAESYSTRKRGETEILGIGGLGKVYLAKYLNNNKFYALKQIPLENVDDVAEKQKQQEAQILSKYNHPFVAQLEYTFQDQEYIYLILEFCQGGQLINYLRQTNHFRDQTAIFFIAQLILIFQDLHEKDIIYRDLNPSNILLHSDGYIRLTEFGLCKVLDGKKKTYTQVGSKCYIPPEVFRHEGYQFVSDYYNLGVIMYELLTGKQIFYDYPENQRMKQIIQQQQLTFPEDVSNDLKNFIQSLINPNPEERLGYNGIQEIKDHAIFQHISWEQILNKQIQSPIQLNQENQSDLSYYNKADKRVQKIQNSKNNNNQVVLEQKIDQQIEVQTN